QDLMHGLVGLRLGHPVYLFHQIGSTNDQAKHLADAGAPEGLLVVAEGQTAGRGRAGRRWMTPPGTALALSLILRPRSPAFLAEHAPRLTMLAGLAACEAIEAACRLRAVLKWPNDVLIAGRKVGGILVETALKGDELDYAVLGLGINVSWAPSPEAVDFPATCLLAEAGHEVDRLSLLRAILTQLEARYPMLATTGDPSLLADWRARLALMGEPIVLHTESGAHAGRAEDVDSAGALIVRLESGEMLRVLAGEVRLRPAR
ncbi:MAG: biotin--[acetyl-CoA-carboxylase] ligase, partial [Anaerolineales bacterium]